MATAVAVDINPFLVKLPEPYDLPSIAHSRWECPHCAEVNDTDDWTTLVIHPTKSTQMVMEKCPDCDHVYDPDNLSTIGTWQCPECGDTFGSSHAAMVCCQGADCDDPDEDNGHCCCRDGILREYRTDGQYADKNSYAFTTFFRCDCGRNEDEECDLLVCIVCHQAMYEQQAKNHDCPGDPVTRYDREQKMREIAAEVTNEVLGEQATGCMCNSGFCCELHGQHALPHMLCERQLA